MTVLTFRDVSKFASVNPANECSSALSLHLNAAEIILQSTTTSTLFQVDSSNQ